MLVSLIGFVGICFLLYGICWLALQISQKSLSTIRPDSSIPPKGDGFTIDEIRNAPSGTLYDVVKIPGSENLLPNTNKTIALDDSYFEEAISYIQYFLSNKYTYNKIRKMRRCKQGKAIKFSCKAEFVMFARGVAELLPSSMGKQLRRQPLYPWSLDGSTPLFENPEILERNLETFDL